MCASRSESGAAICPSAAAKSNAERCGQARKFDRSVAASTRPLAVVRTGYVSRRVRLNTFTLWYSKKGVLLARELADANASIDSPGIKQLDPDLRHHYQLLIAREGDVALVEQMIDVRRQQQAVGPVQAFRVRCVTPRLDVAGLQVSRLSSRPSRDSLFP